MKNLKKIGLVILFVAVAIYLLFTVGRDVAEMLSSQVAQEADAGETGEALSQAETEDAATEEETEVPEAVTPTEAPTATPEPTEEAEPTATPVPTEEPEPTVTPEPTATPAAAIDENGVYDSKKEVALYIHTYGHLPSNYITKKEAKALGWEGGGLDAYAPGKCIGGDYYGNYEGVLPEGDYHECDIDTLGKSKRGAKRIVYDSDGDIYYTSDHYESFTQLY